MADSKFKLLQSLTWPDSAYDPNTHIIRVDFRDANDLNIIVHTATASSIDAVTDGYRWVQLDGDAPASLKLPGAEALYPIDIQFGPSGNENPLVTNSTLWSDMQEAGAGSGSSDIIISDAAAVAAANAAHGGQSVGGGESFLSLIGRPESGDARGQRHPEEIKLATGDVLEVGPLSMDKDWMVVSSVIQGKVSDLSNHDTDCLLEGTVNKYYTSQRARDELSASISQAANGMGNFTYDSNSGTYALEQPSDTWLRERISLQATLDLNLTIDADPLAAFSYSQASGEMQLSTATAGDVKGLLSAPADDGLDYNADGEFSLVQDIRTLATPVFAGMTINGDLQVNGAQLIANVTTVEVEDNIFHLNKS